VLEYASDPRIRPLLVLEPKTERSERSASGEQVNPWMSGLLEQGFTMVQTGRVSWPGSRLAAATSSERRTAPRAR